MNAMKQQQRSDDFDCQKNANHPVLRGFDESTNVFLLLRQGILGALLIRVLLDQFVAIASISTCLDEYVVLCASLHDAQRPYYF